MKCLTDSQVYFCWFFYWSLGPTMNSESSLTELTMICFFLTNTTYIAGVVLLYVIFLFNVVFNIGSSCLAAKKKVRKLTGIEQGRNPATLQGIT